MLCCPLAPLTEALLKHPLMTSRLQPLLAGKPAAALPTAGRVLLAAVLARAQNQSVLWVTPTLEAAERLYQDVALFLTVLDPEDRASWQSLRPAPTGELLAATPTASAERAAANGGGGLLAALFPERDTSIFDAGASDPQRLMVLQALAEGQRLLVIAPALALLQRTISPHVVRQEGLTLRRGASVPMETLLTALVERGYERVHMVELRGQMAVRGGLIDIYPSTGEPVRLELFGDQIDALRTFDLDTQRSSTSLDEICVLPLREHEATSWLTDHLPASSLTVLEEPAMLRLRAEEWAADATAGAGPGSSAPGAAWEAIEASLGGRPCLELTGWGTEAASTAWLHAEPVEGFAGRLDAFTEQAAQRVREGCSVVVVTTQDARLREIFAEEHTLAAMPALPPEGPQPGALHVVHGQLTAGWEVYLDDQRWWIISDRELLGTTRRRAIARGAERGSLLRLEDLQPGDSVVHSQHGIGRFDGLVKLMIEGSSKDFVKLTYARGDSVYVPVVQMDMLSKYSSVESATPTLSRLGRGEWQKVRTRVKAQVKDMTEQLLGMHARRHLGQGYAFASDTPWQEEMEAAFPFEETPDQARAIDQVKHDMERTQPMDRLVCGDVGYGKTEVAIRAAFKAVQDGKQVAFLVPTTVLAQQHYKTLRERLAPFPVKIDVLSRFRSTAEASRISDGLREGTIDIVVGTHRLLAKGTRFARLGLLIIDEEQRFGVAHKERLKELKMNVDVLTMSATPIPRTLQMALVGLRDLSLIQTPPKHRLPIKTYLFEQDPSIVQAAIRRELQRDGQVFFVHNRVQGIEKIAADLQELVPEARIVVGHGQMPEQQLERVMLDFADGRYDVLVSTTIIESGLDMPSVNTIIIHQAGMFGLGQLYQLRGRVGRAHQQGYCYLLYSPRQGLTPEAELRLETIREFTALGSGYQIAMRDLEIRGAGNLLGGEQSGQIAAVGFELYCQMLEEAVAELKGSPLRRVVDEAPVIDLPVEAFIPDSYIQDGRHKLTMYKRLADLRTEATVREIREELRDRYGPLPEPVHHLLHLVELKVLCLDMDIPSIKHRKTVIERSVSVVLPTVRTMPPRHLRQLADMAEAEARFADYQLELRGLRPQLDLPERMLAILRWLGTNLTEAMAGHR